MLFPQVFIIIRANVSKLFNWQGLASVTVIKYSYLPWEYCIFDKVRVQFF